MIENINIKGVATFDPTNGVKITDLKKINFFFGFNGSGKSTIAQYLHNLSLEDSQKNIDFKDCTQNGYNESNCQILTFNERFTEMNFNRNSLLKGIFSLDEKNDLVDIEIKKQEYKKNFYNLLQENKKTLIEDLRQDESEKRKILFETCWSKRNTFSTFTKINFEHSGSKPNHLQKLKDILLKPLAIVPTIEQLTERYNSIYEKEIFEITITINSKLYKEIRIIERKFKILLSEVIVGNEDVDIAELIKKLDSRNWVETGVKYLEKTDDICPFCQQKTITNKLKVQLDELFDETYKEKIEEIERLFDLYKKKSNSLLFNISEIQDVYNPNNLTSNTHIKIKKLFDGNYDIIDYKIKHSNKKNSLTSLNTLKSELSKIIKSIEQKNTTFSELDDIKNTLISDIWLFIAQQSQDDIETFKKRNIKYKRIISLANKLKDRDYKKEISTKNKIENLRNQTVNTKHAVENINLILKNNGFDGFEISEKNIINDISQYYLKRKDSINDKPVFQSLSEGEKNFISFLYFFQLCIGTDDIEKNSTKKKIIVIDDPVSSLDSQSLFVISTLIHKLIQQKGKIPTKEKQIFKNPNISQVFILSHNLYFYKEVSFNKRPICTKYRHYRVKKINNISEVSGSDNTTVFDDYSLLWQTLKDIKNNLPTSNSLNIVIANTMRRVIESFVNFIGLGRDSWGTLLADNSEEPKYYIKCSFISTINDESHKVTALDNIYYQKIINEKPQLLFDAFKEIFISIGKEHYELMMKEKID